MFYFSADCNDIKNMTIIKLYNRYLNIDHDTIPDNCIFI